MKKFLVLIIISVFNISPFAQTDFFADDSNDVNCNYNSFDIGSRNSGISFGNSKNWNGLRFNFSDCGIGTINGINITFWKPERSPGSQVNGISLGGAPLADNLTGVNFGLAAVVAENQMQGINIGGLAVVSDGNIKGINIGGLATVAKGNIHGINIGGLATVSEGEQFGINIGGLATVAKGNLSGINFGGLAVVAEENISGINLGGLALVSKGELKGINCAGLAIVSEGALLGLSQAFVAIVGKNEIKGITIAGYKTETLDFTGINISGWFETEYLHGLSISVYNKITNIQRGLVIGLFNVAEKLHGVQIGLINIAKNNKGFAKVLPFINANFD